MTNLHLEYYATIKKNRVKLYWLTQGFHEMLVGKK